jgi:hypothetical protein
MKIALCGIMLSANIVFTFAESIELKYIWSVDTGFTMIALQNSGLGIGVNYEHKVTDFLSIKPGLGFMVIFSDTTIVAFDSQLLLNFYPLSNGLDKLYIGFGSGCDYFMYPAKNDTPEDIAVSIIVIAGWKWRVLQYLMIEPFVGWKFYTEITTNYESVNKYVKGGFQWGISIKVFFSTKKIESVPTS